LVSGGNVGHGGMAISPDNKLVSVAAGSETQTFGFTSGTDYTGATNPLAPLYTTTAIGTAVSVTFSPSTSFLYIGETGVYGSSTTDSGALRMIPISSDALGTEPAITSTYPYPSGGTGPHAILADSNGYVYVANWVNSSGGNITAFLLNATTPSLTLQSNPVSTGVTPSGMIVDSTGNFVLVVNNGGSPPLSAFTFDATTTGKLDTSSLSGSLGAGPVVIVSGH
jgi:DNA-binding beta-propeller fold protein YncE